MHYKVVGGLNKSMYIFRITPKQQFQNSWPTLVYLGLSILLPFYMVSRYGSADIIVFVLMSAALFLIFFIPQLVLHINYYFTNKGDVFIYDPANSSITIEQKGVSHSFSFDEIELIERYKSYPLAENRMHWFPWDGYNYSVIYLKGGKKFLITSLLVPNMDLPIENNKILLRKGFYNLAA